jgi:nitrate reductase assembly molybdenum cofactor insertion protein NarJ
MTPAKYQLLAALFEHPGPGFGSTLRQSITALSENHPLAARALERFGSLLPMHDLRALRDLHTRTFEVQAIASLDIGYTLFGEDYKRGALLAGLSGEHQRAHNDCGTELGDHLTNVLRLLPKLEDTALRAELVETLLAPALRETLREFEPDRIAMKDALYQKHHKTILEVAAGDTRAAYRHALEALYEVLRADFGLSTRLRVARGSKFADSMAAEIGLESSGPSSAAGACGPRAGNP